MREVMYPAFDRLGFEVAGVSSAEAFIKLDGFDGFLFAASRFNMSHPENELWEITSLISDLEDLLGKDRSSALMIAVASRDQDLARLMEAVQQRERSIVEEKAAYRFSPRPIYQDLKSQKFHNSWASELREWSTTATPEEILEKKSVPEAEKSLFLQYEKNPCSNCRETVFQSLIKLDKLPHWMRHECRYDANAETVEAVQ